MKVRQVGISRQSFAIALFTFLCASGIRAYPLQEDGKVFVRGAAPSDSTDVAALKNARDAAIMSAYGSFIDYALARRLELPSELANLRADIFDCVRRAHPALHASLKNVRVKDAGRSDDEIFCILEIPESENLDAVHAKLSEGGGPDIRVLADSNPLLAFEIDSIAGKSPQTERLMNSTLKAASEGKCISELPKAWFMDAGALETATFEELKSEALPAALQALFGTDKFYFQVCRMLHERGYSHAAAVFRSLELPLHDSEGLADDALKQAALKEAAAFDMPVFSIVVRNSGRIKIAQYDEESKNYQKALDLFSGEDPDLEGALGLSVLALSQAPSSNTFNLVGNCLELRGMPSLSAYFYLQSYCMERGHPYASVNLALVLDKAGSKKLCGKWAAIAAANGNISESALAKMEELRSRDLP